MLENDIKELIASYGADVCGIANINRFGDAPVEFNPSDAFCECQAVIAFGVALPKGLTKVKSRLIYGHFNNEVCRIVDEIAFKSAKTIEKDFAGLAVPLDNVHK
ncbi:hypothetical protein [Acetobacterium tundrae]|uniref:Uncharacterized protein n=1 Tax=Acetobacterium tundrae TaxID=132932 RepID=A0ABR6WQ44_9FIRM|nr:hypothetical protein [Acetobacterium tundrae]MBC3798587.1 hypothetical protein [Acetobacterium tundrae]